MSEKFKFKWTIGILSVPERLMDLVRIKGMLEHQIKGRGVQILVNDRDGDVGEKRQWCLDNAGGMYISFVDDDDLVAHNFIDSIYPLLDGVDYIGFRLQLYIGGIKQKPTFHSIKYNNWYGDNLGYYRDISHLNPIRTELARTSKFSCGFQEDKRWVDCLRGKIKTEHYIDQPMYFYFYSKKYSLFKNMRNKKNVNTK